MRRALQPLEQIHPQHRREVVLPRALIEAVRLPLLFQLGRVLQVFGGRVHRQSQGADPAMKVVVGELALAVRWRMQVLRVRPPREPADALFHLWVVAAYVVAGTRDGHRIEQCQEIRAQVGQQGLLGRVTAAAAAARLPLEERALRRAEHGLDVADAQGVLKRIPALLGHQINLVAQIPQAGVHRRGGEHQHLGVDA